MGCGSSAETDGGGNYKIICVLGEGASCTVNEVEDRNTKERYAMKVIKPKYKDLWTKEVEILQQLKKVPNEYIMEFIESGTLGGNFTITTAMCTGGELFDRIVQPQEFTDRQASTYARQMLSSIVHLHNNGLVHRDLKPENFVFATKKQECLKLIDFGVAETVTDTSVSFDFVGSCYYFSPEVLNYDRYPGDMLKKADAWAIGVIIFMIKTGRPPFPGDTDEEIYQKIKNKSTGIFKRGTFKPDSVMDLLSKLLDKNYKKRISAEEALEHPWIKGDSATDEVADANVIKSLKAFHGNNKLKKAMGRVLGNRMTEKDKQAVENVFKKFDKNNDGKLDKGEIAELVKYIQKGGTDEDAKLMMENIDQDNDGEVDMDEFVEMHASNMLKTDAQLKEAFDKLDASGDGLLSAKELEAALEAALAPKHGHVEDGEVAGIMADADGSGDGHIDFDEFVAAMRGFAKPQRPKA